MKLPRYEKLLVQKNDESDHEIAALQEENRNHQNVTWSDHLKDAEKQRKKDMDVRKQDKNCASLIYCCQHSFVYGFCNSFEKNWR